MNTKKCSRCGIVQTDENSHLKATGTFQSYCRPCRNIVTKEYAATHKLSDAQKQKRAQIKYKYGLNQKEYEDLISKGCSICGSHENLCVDHDHACCFGKRSCGTCIRGALCQRHNKAFGFVSDSIEELQKMINYLLL